MIRPYTGASHGRTEKPDIEMFNMHTHDCYEIFCFLAGDAEYFVEGTIYPLHPGDILVMKKSEAHTLLVKSKRPYERIVVNFNAEAIIGERQSAICSFLDSRPLGVNNCFAAAKFKGTNWVYYLDQICSTTERGKRRLYITVLLSELFEAYPSISSNDSLSKTDPIADMIIYINSHLTESLSLEHICTKFFISKAQLNRKFKKVTGSTVWEYITTKRLLLAKELLQNGEPPTKACIKSGFSNYCSFYKAYKAQFGINPKTDHNHDTLTQDATQI